MFVFGGGLLLLAPRFVNFVPPLLGAEVRRVDDFQSTLGGKHLGAAAHQQHVLRFLHHGAGGGDRIFDHRDAGHGAGPLFTPLHDRGIQFVAAFVREDGPLAGVEMRRVFQNADGGLDSIQSACRRLL